MASRIYILVPFFSFFSFGAFAQTGPAFSYADYTAEDYTMPKTIQQIKLSSSELIEAPLSGSNQVWDYGSLQRSPEASLFYYPVRDTFFPGAGMMLTGEQDYIKGTFIPYNLYQTLDASGFKTLGKHFERFAMNLSQITGTPGDSMIVYPQNVANLPNPLFEVVYPQAFGNSFVSGAKQQILGEVSFSLAGYNQESFTWQTDARIEAEVAAWGTLIVPTVGGQSEPIPVLMQRTKYSLTDSFFIGGQPAPPQLLSSFGLPSGSTETNYYTHFYRAGSFIPLLSFYQGSQGFGDVVEAMLRYDELGTSSVNETFVNLDLRVYPNPATEFVQVLTQFPNTKIELFDLNGKLVYHNFYGEPGMQVLQLPLVLPNGIYQIRTSNDSGIQVQPLLISGR